jgi:hypothetical protein
MSANKLAFVQSGMLREFVEIEGRLRKKNMISTS